MKFEIEVTRTSYATTKIEIEADNLQQAKEKALEEAGDIEFGSGQADYEVTGSKQC